MKDHQIELVHEGCTVSQPVQVTPSGDLNVRDDAPTIEDFGSHMWVDCNVCGRLGSDEYEDHGIADDWEYV